MVPLWRLRKTFYGRQQSTKHKPNPLGLGALTGSLLLPCTAEDVFNFCAENRLTQTYQKRLILLNQEAGQNNRLQVWITGHHA